jgi:predicted small metal-binding protein
MRSHYGTPHSPRSSNWRDRLGRAIIAFWQNSKKGQVKKWNDVLSGQEESSKKRTGVEKIYKYAQDNVPVGAKMPSFKCIAKNCPFETSAPTEAELMKKIAEHAKTAHNMDPIPPDTMAKVKAAIKP